MESINSEITYFDSPGRSSITEINREKSELNSQPLINQILEGYPNLAVILNKNRQIIQYNKNAEKLLFPDAEGKITGQRMGEALKCIHAFEMNAGCGASKFCAQCGAAKCNKYTKETLKSCTEECRITVENNTSETSLDLRVYTSNLNYSGENYILFTIENIEDEKRRKILEKIFFHDVLNTATAIHGIAEIITSSNEVNEINEFSGYLINSSQQLICEIQNQRDLTEAENGNLTINVQSKSANVIIERAYEMYKDSHLSLNKGYKYKLLDKDVLIETDSVYLIRSIGNLIKNALEASNKNDEININCSHDQEYIYFNIQNDGVMPEVVQLQLFQRSFSTKAANGRGIGTYSVKLLIEQYLKGKVYFVSIPGIGTIFTICLPLKYF